MNVPFRIGYGLDIHRWEKGRRLVLGGVEIPHDMGLLGHSDADALTHSVIDALLGALALGDIGQHFPDTDPQYKDADSFDLLRRTMILIEEKQYTVGNVDSIVITDAPKLAPYILPMRRALARVLKIDDDCISVKATRTEGVLFPVTNGLLAASTVLLIQK